MATCAVMCAYGPRRTTRRAVQRLRAQLAADDRLYVYAGTRAGRVSGLGSHGVIVLEGIGRDGLLAALQAAGSDDFVLHLSDGVTLPPAAMTRLAEAHAGTGKLVVPWTNDVGTDHYAGPLRIDGANLLRELSEQSRLHRDTVEARIVRPTCIGGSRRQMLGLVPFHLAYPTTVLRLIESDCIVVGSAVAAHDGAAERRLLPPESPDARPLLVASMIVKDEEDFLGDCLASLRTLVDRIDVYDTGSSDATVAIAREAGANVRLGEWRDDFGWARNQALAMSEDAWWVLWIDADERVEVDDPDHIRRELATAIGHFDSLGVAIINPGMGDEDGSNWVTPRILRPNTMHYEGPLHEQIVPRSPALTTATTTLDGLRIAHYGYAADVVERRGKGERNLDISRAAYEANPNDPTAALQYARSLSLAGCPASERLTPLRTAERGFAEGGVRIRALVGALLGQALAEEGDLEQAMACARAALDLIPIDDVAMDVLLRCAQEAGVVESVSEYLDRYAEGSSLRPLYEEPSLRIRNRSFRVAALLEAGRIDEAVEYVRVLAAEGARELPAWPQLIDALLAGSGAEAVIDTLSRVVSIWRGGDWARPLARRVRHDLVIDLVELACATGNSSREALQVGLTVSMLREDWDAFRRLVAFVDVLPDGDRIALGSRLEERGAPWIADLVYPEEVSQTPPQFLL